MSIAAATRNAFAVEAEAKNTEFRKAAAQAPAVQGALEQVTQWIPTEVVTLYVAGLGFLALTGSTGKWIVFAAGAALVPAAVVLNAALVNKRAKIAWQDADKPGDAPRIGRKKELLLILVALVAFVFWACALPSTPFLTIWDQATRLGAFLVLVYSAFMPTIAELLALKLPGKDT